MSSSGECSDARIRAHHMSVSSGDQTLQTVQSPRSPTLERDRVCAHCNRTDEDEDDNDDATSTPIQSDDLFPPSEENDPGWRYMAWAQQNDPVWRMVQSFHGQAWLVLREMDREILKTTKGFVNGCRSGSKHHWKYVRKLRKIMPERMAFVASLVTLETLPEPSRKAVEDTVQMYPTGEDEDRQAISPPTSREHWKSLRRVTRQARLVDSLPLLGRFGELVSLPFRIGQDEAADSQGRRVNIDTYKTQHTYNVVLLACSLTIGVFVCIPVVFLGMDVGSKADKLAVIVGFIVSFGVLSAYWLDDPAIAIATMLAFAASLVNVSL